MATSTKKKKVNVVRRGDRTPKEAEREMYKVWLSMPAMLRGMKEADLRMMGYNVDDPTFQKLLSIKTKVEFCREFGVSINMPVNWEKREGFMDEVNALSVNDNVMRFKKDVDFSFTQKVIRHGDAHRMKLWKQLYEGWTEKVENRNLNVNLDLVNLVNSIRERNQKLRENPDASLSPTQTG